MTLAATEQRLGSLWICDVYHETAFPFAIYAGNTLVGFIMLGYYKLRNQYTLWKFLIDKQYQKKEFPSLLFLLDIINDSKNAFKSREENGNKTTAATYADWYKAVYVPVPKTEQNVGE